MKVLITGFDPFGGEQINPAFEAVKRLDDTINGCKIIKLEVPTVFRRSIEILEDAIKEHNPDRVICVGQAGGRSNITVEKVAINIDDAMIPDNEGNQPIDMPIFSDGNDGYFSNLPIKRMVRIMNENLIPAEVSYTAGTYVCNHIMYGLLYLIDKKYPNILGGFIHVPFINEQVTNKPNTAFMNLDDIVKGLKYAIIGAIDDSKDDKIVGGQIC